jgi:uncharacterized membrane-anchored protein YhcB (DUF1043 family)
MDVVIPLALLVVGVIIGFFVARYIYTKDGAVKANEQAENAVKELMAQQAQHHLHQVKQAISGFEKQCQSLQQHVDDYEQLLAQNTDENNPRVPFYGEQASIYLRNKLKDADQSSRVSSSDTQPRDFAQSGSGLFAGAETKANPEKE